MERFTELRRVFDAKHKSVIGTNTRPHVPQILDHISLLRQTSPYQPELTLQAHAEHPMATELENYVVAFNAFHHRCFSVPVALLSGRGIPSTLCLDRVNAIVKLFDRSKGGISALNRGRSRQHVPKKSRMIENAQESHDPRTSLATPEARKAFVAENRSILPRLGATVRAAEEKAKASAATDNAAQQTPTEHATREQSEADPEENMDSESDDEGESKGAGDDKTRKIVSVSSTRGKGMQVVDPSKKGKKITCQVTRPPHTADEMNPRASWFKDGWAIGYNPETTLEVQNFKETY
jgi:hypothetical protein